MRVARRLGIAFSGSQWERPSLHAQEAKPGSTACITPAYVRARSNRSKALEIAVRERIRS